MLGRLVMVTFDQVSVSAAQDLFSIKASSSVPIAPVRLILKQSTKAQDANEFQVRWRVRRGQTSQGSGGSTPTGVKKITGDGTITSTIHANDTTQASGGTIETMVNSVFNDRAGEEFIWTPNDEFLVAVSTCLTVELPAAPSATLTMNGTLWYMEFG